MNDPIRRLSIADIQHAVARSFGLSTDQMLSRRRSRRIAGARQAAMYLCRELANGGRLGHRRQAGSFPRIGLAFGRDHTSVIHACDAVARRRLHDPNLALKLDALARDLTQLSPAHKAAPAS